jgi:hypothetical protein
LSLVVCIYEQGGRAAVLGRQETSAEQLVASLRQFGGLQRPVQPVGQPVAELVSVCGVDLDGVLNICRKHGMTGNRLVGQQGHGAIGAAGWQAAAQEPPRRATEADTDRERKRSRDTP